MPAPIRSSFVNSSAALRFALPLAILTIAAGCTPTVKVEAPDKPIVINMNIKIEQEVRVKIEEQARDDITENPDIF